MKQRKILFSVIMLLVSAVMLSTASFAWFSMNTTVYVEGIEFEAYSDSLFLQISENEDSGYADNITVRNGDKILRPSAIAFLPDEGAWVPTFAPATGFFDPSSTQLIYARVGKADANDSYSNPDYVVVNGLLNGASSVAGYYNETDGQIRFDIVTTPQAPQAGVQYYVKEGNSYVPKAASEITDVYGYYTVTLIKPCEANETYINGNRYFEVHHNGIISPVGGLVNADSLNGYYVVASESRAQIATAGKDYFVKNNNGDYISLGNIETGVKLDSTYQYCYRAYSDQLNVSQGEKLNAVIDESKYTVDNIPYYLYDVFYLRMADGAGTGDNLKVSAVNISGTDSLNDAIRVLFVATNGEGKVSRVVYNNRTGEITHMDGSVLFSKILGDEAETVKVEVYVYYDGTDDAVLTNGDVYFSGHTIKCEFSIDVPEYLQHD